MAKAWYIRNLKTNEVYEEPYSSEEKANNMKNELIEAYGSNFEVTTDEPTGEENN